MHGQVIAGCTVVRVRESCSRNVLLQSASVLLFAIGGLGKASKAATTLTTGSGPLANIDFTTRPATLALFAPVLRLCGWVGVAMTIGGTIYCLYADNNPLEDWLNNCA